MKNLFMIGYRIRTALPEPVKLILRGLKLLITPAPPASPVIPQNLLDGCRLLSSRDDMLPLLPRGGKICEVGVFYGDFSRKIIKFCAPTELHLADLNFDNLYDDVRMAPCVKLHQKMSVEVLKEFPDAYFDWIYIDADHTYEGVKADIAAAMSKVRPGGYLAFNDFARIVRNGLGTFGVHQAVCEFAAEQKWPFAFFCFQGQALYDVALQRPL